MIPITAQKMAQSGKYDAIICVELSSVEILHIMIWCVMNLPRESHRLNLQQESVLFGVITTENIEQAIARAGNKAGNKGYDCALSAIEMVNLMKQL